DEFTRIKMPPHESKSGVRYEFITIDASCFCADRFRLDQAPIAHLDATKVSETFVAATIIVAEDALDPAGTALCRHPGELPKRQVGSKFLLIFESHDPLLCRR